MAAFNEEGNSASVPTKEQMVDYIQVMTLADATEIVAKLQESFDFNLKDILAKSVGAPAPAEDGLAAKAEKTQTTFDVMVEDVPSDKRVAVLKVIRKLTSLGLADAKNFTTSLPKALKEGVSQEEADEAKAALEEAGATVAIN